MIPFSRRHLLFAGSATALALVASKETWAKSAVPLVPYGALPSARQLAWHAREAYGFVHFTVNTFTDREWGYGDEPESVFDPSDFSAEQIVMAAKAGGLSALILTAKHHDGFCLWPSAYTEHSIKKSPYKGGKGDIVREMAEACAAGGLAFGVYLSPWDRNHAEYGRPAYVEYYHNQLRELTTQYGKLFEVWFDGANGGDGYYGGAREVRKIDGKTYYQWDKVRAIVRQNQPDAVMFADADMDIRWVGNEEGHAGDPCWPTVDTLPYTRQKGNQGVRGGSVWNPAETDVSIRKGWFWHADEKPRSPANLTKVYFESVGRGATLLLNLAPDRRGRIPDEDIASLQAWKTIRETAFTHNFAKGATVKGSSVAKGDMKPANVLKPGLFWAADTTDVAGAWLSVTLPKPQTFDVIQVSEDLRLGLRVDDYVVEIMKEGKWEEVARHTCIGYKRLIRLEAPVTAKQVRLRILKGAASPVLGNFGLFRLPDIIEEPSLTRDSQGMVRIEAPQPGYAIHYTLDGSPASANSPAYTGAFALTEGGTVRAVARNPKTNVISAETVSDFDISPVRWRVMMATGDKPQALLSGGTLTGFEKQPLEVVIDLAQPYDLKGFTLKPPSPPNHPTPGLGAPAAFEAYLSDDGANWRLAMKGEFSNIAANRALQIIRFSKAVRGRYFKLVLPRAVLDRPVIAIDGIGILTR